MKKWSIYSLVVILITLTFERSFAQVELLKTTQLDSFPSASSVSYFNNRLYVIGDDAPDLLVLDANHQKVQDIVLFKAKSKRIKKDEKADLEASGLYLDKNKKYLVGISSFSSAFRNKILVYDLSKPERTPKLIKSKDPLRDLNIEETNLEGAAFVNEKLLLSNRANNTHKTNYLIVAGFNHKRGIRSEDAENIKLELPQTSGVVGISGLEYVKEKDMLLFVASTEQTENATDDGAIGDSYIGYISNISRKLNEKVIKADEFLSFAKTTNNNNTYKIESIALESVNNNELLIHLASDNDDGKSTLFKLKWKLESK